MTRPKNGMATRLMMTMSVAPQRIIDADGATTGGRGGSA